jgi:hypothetical protein
MLCSALPNWLGAEQIPSTQPRAVSPAPPPGVNPDAALLSDFKKRIDEYMTIHNKVAKDAPPMKETNNPTEIKNAQTAFGEKLRQARAAAQPGDIFTVQIQQKFRRLLAPQLKGEDGQDAKKVLKDDAPTAVPLKVNANYPDGLPRPTTPAKILLNLPTLPEPLEYRIIAKNLVLVDTKGNIIVDFIANAIT